MKVVELLSVSEKLIKALHENGIKTSEVELLPMYGEYKEMMQNGDKKTFIVEVLAERYNISVRQIYKTIQRFEKDCKIRAVGI